MKRVDKINKIRTIDLDGMTYIIAPFGSFVEIWRHRQNEESAECFPMVFNTEDEAENYIRKTPATQKEKDLANK